MTINQLTRVPAASSARGRRLLTLTGVAGAGYSLSWIAGLGVRAPSPAFGASGVQIVRALAGHQSAVALQFALTEGLPAFGIAAVSVALARAARHRGSVVTGRIAFVSGLVAAAISLTQFAVGMALARTAAPGTAHLLYEAVNRMDGVKMLTLAVLGLAGAAAGTAVLPRWLRWTGAVLAASIATSGVVYLLLVQSLTIAAGPALLALLIFVTGSGLVLGTKAS
jgi:hypothetical protein